MHLGEFFKDIRKYKGLKQKDVAQEVGITHVALSRFEAGRSVLSQETLSKIAVILDINPRFLTDQSMNPFYSNELLKMYLSADFMEVKYSLLSLFQVMLRTQVTDMYLLVPPISLLDRLVRMNISQEIPVYAITCRDREGNMYLFRRKSANEFILKPKELIVGIKNMLYTVNKARERIPFPYKVKKIDNALYEKIKDWSVEKEDIAFLFEEKDKAKIIYEYALSINAGHDDIQKALEFFKDPKK